MMGMIWILLGTLIIGIGTCITTVSLFPMIAKKNKNLQIKFGQEIESEPSYRKIFVDGKLTGIGKIILICGVFLILIGTVLLLLV